MNRLLIVSLVAFLLIPGAARAQDDLDLDNPYGVAPEENPFSRDEDAAAAEETPAEDAPAEASEDDEPADEVEDDSDGPVREHGLAIGYHMTRIVSQGDSLDEAKQFTLHAPSVAYSFYRGYRFGFLMNLEFFFPLRGTQNVDAAECDANEACNIRQLYDQNLGYDASFMMAYHSEPMPDLSINAGVGVHFNVVELSDDQLRDFNNISLGIGSMATVRYNIHEIVSVGANTTLSFDWADMIHETGKLKYGVNFSISGVVGIHL